MKMGGQYLVLLFLSLAAFFFNSSQARSITSASIKPLIFIETNQSATAARSCSYTLTIKTSCSSPKYTRDRVSIAFGDAYGFEVYAPRIDNPSSRIFESCSTDTFQIRGPCIYEICYLYLKRVGSDGWKPESVKIYGPDRPAITFKYNKLLPNGVWKSLNTNPLEAELKALRRGIQIAIQHNFKQLHIETDAQEVIECFKSGTSLYDNLVFDCRSFLSRLEVWELHHVFREQK